MREFKKQICKPGEYRVRGNTVRVEPADVDHWEKQLTEMRSKGFLVPAPYHHDDKAMPVRDKAELSDMQANNNAGFWDRYERDSEGGLWGILQVERDEDAEKIGKTVRGVSLYSPKQLSWQGKDWDRPITHIALTNHPVVDDQGEFIALSADAWASDLEPTNDTNPDHPADVSLDSAMAVLAKLGIQLPDDTNEMNFLERLVVAGTALANAKQEDDDLQKPPEGTERKKQPSPIAMSTDPLSLAIDRLKEVDTDNADSYSADYFKREADKANGVQQFSADQQNMIDGAYATHRTVRKTRAQELVKSRRVSAKYAKEHLEPMIRDSAVEFSAGEFVQQPIDRLLVALEALPAGAALDGASLEDLQRTNAAGMDKQPDAFSLELDGITMQDPPEDVTGKMAEKDADELADRLASAG